MERRAGRTASRLAHAKEGRAFLVWPELNGCTLGQIGQPPVRIKFFMLRVLALLPWIHLVVFGSFVLRAYAVLGYWPRYDQPDPKSLGFALHHVAVVLSMLPALYGPLVVVPGFVILWKKLSASWDLRCVAVLYCVGTVMAWSIWWFDLGGWAVWIVD